MPQQNPCLGCKQSISFRPMGKVPLFPASDFVPKNLLAREGSQSVSPMINPALTTILDRQLKENRALCPVCAQRPERVLIPTLYFLQERTYLRHQAHYALFLVKTTILLCYKQANQQSLDLVQVKAHDIRAFAMSKAFYGGVL